MDMNGKVLWKTKRNPDFDRGSMILADGLLLATDGLKTLYLIEPNPTAFKPLSKAALLGQKGKGADQNWAPIALSDGKLLIRDQNVLLCVKVVK
jgi:hypothetical protein